MNRHSRLHKSNFISSSNNNVDNYGVNVDQGNSITPMGLMHKSPSPNKSPYRPRYEHLYLADDDSGFSDRGYENIGNNMAGSIGDSTGTSPPRVVFQRALGSDSNNGNMGDDVVILKHRVCCLCNAQFLPANREEEDTALCASCCEAMAESESSAAAHNTSHNTSQNTSQSNQNKGHTAVIDLEDSHDGDAYEDFQYLSQNDTGHQYHDDGQQNFFLEMDHTNRSVHRGSVSAIDVYKALLHGSHHEDLAHLDDMDCMNGLSSMKGHNTADEPCDPVSSWLVHSSFGTLASSGPTSTAARPCTVAAAKASASILGHADNFKPSVQASASGAAIIAAPDAEASSTVDFSSVSGTSSGCNSGAKKAFILPDSQESDSSDDEEEEQDVDEGTEKDEGPRKRKYAVRLSGAYGASAATGNKSNFILPDSQDSSSEEEEGEGGEIEDEEVEEVEEKVEGEVEPVINTDTHTTMNTVIKTYSAFILPDTQDNSSEEEEEDGGERDGFNRVGTGTQPDTEQSEDGDDVDPDETQLPGGREPDKDDSLDLSMVLDKLSDSDNGKQESMTKFQFLLPESDSSDSGNDNDGDTSFAYKDAVNMDIIDKDADRGSRGEESRQSEKQAFFDNSFNKYYEVEDATVLLDPTFGAKNNPLHAGTGPNKMELPEGLNAGHENRENHENYKEVDAKAPYKAEIDNDFESEVDIDDSRCMVCLDPDPQASGKDRLQMDVSLCNTDVLYM